VTAPFVECEDLLAVLVTTGVDVAHEGRGWFFGVRDTHDDVSLETARDTVPCPQSGGLGHISELIVRVVFGLRVGIGVVLDTLFEICLERGCGTEQVRRHVGMC